MSGTVDRSIPFTVLEANREQLERLAESSLPIADDARRTLELLKERRENE